MRQVAVMVSEHFIKHVLVTTGNVSLGFFKERRQVYNVQFRLKLVTFKDIKNF